ncbi:MAG: hypothetical protein GEV08_04890 [Acidimicrobiia bacterium]|nr:hypothetical protein [Acidimicrobiia bacterium]
MSAGYAVIDGKAAYDGRTLAEWLPDILDELVAAADPQRIVLFGSVARADDGPDSDIDMMVVLSHLDYARRRELTSHLRSSLSSPAPIQLFLTDDRECRRRRDVVGSMHYNPLREGRLVHERARRVADQLPPPDAPVLEPGRRPMLLSVLRGR